MLQIIEMNNIVICMGETFVANDRKEFDAEGVHPKLFSSQKEVFNSYLNWLETNLGDERARKLSEQIIKILLKAEARWQVAVMKLFLQEDLPQGDELFDKARSMVIKIIQGLPKYPLFENQEIEKQLEVQRWLFSEYILRLLNIAKGNEEVDVQLRGIAWSLLAKDAKVLLLESGYIINSDWLFNVMRPLIRESAEATQEQLAHFVAGSPKIIETPQK